MSDPPGQGPTQTVSPSFSDRTATPSFSSLSCPTCGGASPSSCPTCGGSPDPKLWQTPYVYAIGSVEPRCPTPAVEKELAQAVGRAQTVNLTDRQAMQHVLADRKNRYIVRHLCWVFSVRGLDTYILQPRNAEDLDLLIESFQLTPNDADVSDADVSVIIGMVAGTASPEMCNGLVVPVVRFDQMYSFDRQTFIDSMPKPQSIADKQFKPAAEEIFNRILQMTGNAGATDEHRALNYLAMRYSAIYSAAAEAYARNATLSAVEVRRAPIGQPRTVLDVIFSFTDRKTDVTDKQSARVDVTEEFPFLIAKLAPYYDHR